MANRTAKKNKSNIFRDRVRNDVVVLDENGKEVFRMGYSKQVVSIANAIWMSHKHPESRKEV